jgi:hypothetical protein
MKHCSARSHIRAVLEAWRADYNNERPHSRLGWMSPAIYAAARRSAALRSTDGFAPRTAATTAQQGITDDQTPSSLDKNWGQRHGVSSSMWIHPASGWGTGGGRLVAGRALASDRRTRQPSGPISIARPLS